MSGLPVNSKADLAEAFAKNCLECECENNSHSRHPELSEKCLPAKFEHRTAYGNFIVCESCHDLGHMPEVGAAFDSDDDMPETVGIR